MRRQNKIIAFGALILVIGNFSFPYVFSFLDALEIRRIREHRTTLRDIGTPTSGQLQKGLFFFQDLDEVKFTYHRSFHGTIEISVSKPQPLRPNDPLKLTCFTRGPMNEFISVTDTVISNDTFIELRNYVTMEDVFETSLDDPVTGLDGSTWILEGRKGGFWIRHVRWSPADFGDRNFAAIGKRFLDVAGVRIPDKEFY